MKLARHGSSRFIKRVLKPPETGFHGFGMVEAGWRLTVHEAFLE